MSGGLCSGPNCYLMARRGELLCGKCHELLTQASHRAYNADRREELSKRVECLIAWNEDPSLRNVLTAMLELINWTEES